MKILHIIAGAAQGGAESCAVDTIKALHAAGIEQTLICRPHAAFQTLVRDCAIEHHNLSFNRVLKWTQKAKINAIIKNEKPDLVHCWLNRAANFTPHQKTVPVLGWFGGYYDLKYYKSCDFYMGVTKDIVRYIGNVTRAPDRTYIGHAFGTLEPMGEVKKSDYGISDTTKVVLMLSRMHWKKGVDLLIDAASKIDDVVFLIAGDGPEIEKYRKQAHALNLESRVLFLGLLAFLSLPQRPMVLNTMSIMKKMDCLLTSMTVKGSLMPCNAPYMTKRFAPSLSKVGLKCMRNCSVAKALLRR